MGFEKSKDDNSNLITIEIFPLLYKMQYCAQKG
jgi:hypothetical protein